MACFRCNIQRGPRRITARKRKNTEIEITIGLEMDGQLDITNDPASATIEPGFFTPKLNT